jgi:hypothetical protein
MVSSGQGCGDEGKARCQAAAEAKGYSLFSMQWPQGNCQCFIGDGKKDYKQWGESKDCVGDKGEGGSWAGEVYEIVQEYTCPGYMFYTQKSDGGQGDLLFEDALQQYPFHILTPEVASKGFTCDNDGVGLDPVPGQQKACWCDATKTAWVDVT